MVCEQVEAAVCPEGGTAAGFGDVGRLREAVQVETVFRSLAMTCGAAPVRTVERSSSKLRRAPNGRCSRFPSGWRSQAAIVAGPGVFEREAADCVDDLQGAFAGAAITMRSRVI